MQTLYQLAIDSGGGGDGFNDDDNDGDDDNDDDDDDNEDDDYDDNCKVRLVVRVSGFLFLVDSV